MYCGCKKCTHIFYNAGMSKSTVQTGTGIEAAENYVAVDP